MRTLDAESVDSIVTDPPYGLSFMGKGWDHGVPGVEFWTEALRIAKPGAHLLAFGGTRTYHRLAVAIEDAGWEIRDCVMWVYGSGFPKSHDVSKAIDREAGAEREAELVPTKAGNTRRDRGTTYATETHAGFRDISAPATEAAKQWQGWGTALKPAYEPIIVARKPLRGTVAGNVLEWGTGGINVDGCRIDFLNEADKGDPNRFKTAWSGNGSNEGWQRESHKNYVTVPVGIKGGRWPANFIHDGSEEVGNLLGDAARFFYCAKASKRDRDEGLRAFEEQIAGGMSGRHDGTMGSVTMSRNHHPTVKPTDLMRYLCRLVTPPDGLVLDPFTGSGSTGKAAILEGFRFVGCELSAEYIEIARARIGHAAGQSRQKELALA
jgi:site-specific DNA-methyltransferase (adenine-specific)